MAKVLANRFTGTQPKDGMMQLGKKPDALPGTLKLRPRSVKKMQTIASQTSSAHPAIHRATPDKAFLLATPGKHAGWPHPDAVSQARRHLTGEEAWSPWKSKNSLYK